MNEMWFNADSLSVGSVFMKDIIIVLSNTDAKFSLELQCFPPEAAVV